MSQLTHEERLDIVIQSHLAEKRGDEVEAQRIIQQLPMAPWLAKAVKEIFGPEHLKGWDLSKAEAEYGKDWLSR